jgi:hypothetical protein
MNTILENVEEILDGIELEDGDLAMPVYAHVDPQGGSGGC